MLNKVRGCRTATDGAPKAFPLASLLQPSAGAFVTSLEHGKGPIDRKCGVDSLVCVHLVRTRRQVVYEGSAVDWWVKVRTAPHFPATAAGLAPSLCFLWTRLAWLGLVG